MKKHIKSHFACFVGWVFGQAFGLGFGVGSWGWVVGWVVVLVVFLCLVVFLSTCRFFSIQSTCGLVAMTSASHAEGRQFDPGQVYFDTCF